MRPQGLARLGGVLAATLAVCALTFAALAQPDTFSPGGGGGNGGIAAQLLSVAPTNFAGTLTAGTVGATNVNVTTQYVQAQFVQQIVGSNVFMWLLIGSNGVTFTNSGVGNFLPRDWWNTNGFGNRLGVDFEATSALGGFHTSGGTSTNDGTLTVLGELAQSTNAVLALGSATVTIDFSKGSGLVLTNASYQIGGAANFIANRLNTFWLITSNSGGASINTTMGGGWKVTKPQGANQTSTLTTTNGSTSTALLQVWPNVRSNILFLPDQ